MAAVQYSTATRFVITLSVLQLLLAVVMWLVADSYPKYGRAAIYSTGALILGFMISSIVASSLAQRDEERNESTEIQLPRTHPQPERPAERNRSTQIQLEIPETNARSQLQPERAEAERSRISPDFHTKTRLIIRLLRNLAPLESYKRSNKTEGSNDECAICLEEFKIGELVQPFPICNHQFHASCINSWLLGGKNTCPTCRCSIQDLSS